MNPTEKSVRVRISGRVQGVWFRGWMIREAEQRGVSGWVRNLANGEVEATFHGAVEAVDDMIEACWHGPRASRVTDIVVAPAAAPAPGFHQAPDG